MNYEDEQTDSSNSGMAFLTGLLAGAVIGAGVGMLCAPRKGSELRGQVSDAATNFGKAMSKTADDVMQRGRNLYDRARDVAARTGTDMQGQGGMQGDTGQSMS